MEKKNIFPTQPIKKNFLFIPIIIDEKKDEFKIYSDNIILKNWSKFFQKNKLITYILPSEDIEDLKIIKNKYDSIENYDFKEIISKYFLDNSIIALIFINNQDLRILSRIKIKEKTIIKKTSFENFDPENEEKISTLIDGLKIMYEDEWKIYNQINTSIKLPLIIKISNNDLQKIISFEKILKDLDLVNNFNIQSINKDFTYYKIIFNGAPSTFIEVMHDKNFKFNTEKKIWVLK